MNKIDYNDTLETLTDLFLKDDGKEFKLKPQHAKEANTKCSQLLPVFLDGYNFLWRGHAREKIARDISINVGQFIKYPR